MSDYVRCMQEENERDLEYPQCKICLEPKHWPGGCDGKCEEEEEEEEDTSDE